MAKAVDIPKADKSTSFQDIIRKNPNATHAWIRKQTKHNRALELFSKTVKYQWPKRIVVLCSGCLYVYKSEKDTAPCSAVSLFGYSKLTKFEDSEKTYQRWGFSIEHSQTFEGSVLGFAALSEEQREWWLEKFDIAMNYANFSRVEKPPPLPKRSSTRSDNSLVFDVDEPEPSDEYWRVKDVMKNLNSQENSGWPKKPAPPPPNIPPPRKAQGAQSRPLPEIPTSQEYAALQHEDYFQYAFCNDLNGDRLLDGIIDDGVYLVRNNSGDRDKKTLSIFWGHVRKYRIFYEDGAYFLELARTIDGADANTFGSMNDLLEHYHRNPLPSKNSQQRIMLVMPYSNHPSCKK